MLQYEDIKIDQTITHFYHKYKEERHHLLRK